MPRGADYTLTRNAAVAGTALTSLCLIAAGVALVGQEHAVGSLPGYVASHKALTIAWVEPAQQAQMEAPAVLAGNTPAPAATPEPKAQTQVAALAGPVPLPRARPRQMIAAVPLPRERVAEKAPELPAPVTIAAVGPETPLSNTNLAADMGAPSPQLPPPREERQEPVAAADNPIEAVAEAKADAPRATLQSVKHGEVADAAPVPTTFGPARPAPSFQLTSYAPTREQLFERDITGSVGNPLRDFGPSAAPAALARSVPETTRAIPQPHDISKPSVKPSRPRSLTIQEKLWGSPVRLASLTPMDAVRDDDESGLPHAPYDRQTAVYVISDKKVYMPDGRVLEAHSGLGDRMDDPRFVHLRMRGATPPHVYDLTLRESLFHGVEAIRMTPIGGERAIFGRDGILAHTYMLGPSGQSNGCVSFKDYDAFLDAFKAGKINRLAVIARLD